MAAVINEVRAAGIMVFRVLNQKIEYLLLQASYLGHHWTAPKGHVDPGETDELLTAQREVQEESGLRPEDYEIIDGFTYTLRVKHNLYLSITKQRHYQSLRHSYWFLSSTP